MFLIGTVNTQTVPEYYQLGLESQAFTVYDIRNDSIFGSVRENQNIRMVRERMVPILFPQGAVLAWKLHANTYVMCGNDAEIASIITSARAMGVKQQIKPPKEYPDAYREVNKDGLITYYLIKLGI